LPAVFAWAEADMLMDIYIQLAAQVPDLVFIIAPRHIERSARIAELLARQKGIDFAISD
jgi:3-deoxy-D-manno-octulosonic-acid transferase